MESMRSSTQKKAESNAPSLLINEIKLLQTKNT